MMNNFLFASNFLRNHIPFLIYKPDLRSIDETVPYLAHKFNYKLIKIGLHDIGVCVKADLALYIVKDVLAVPIYEPTILWLEDISSIDDKISFIHRVNELITDPNYFIVFTGIKECCNELNGMIPTLEWDTHYPEVKNYHMTYIQPCRCSTVLDAPADLHFRTYMHMLDSIKSFITGPNALDNIIFCTEQDSAQFSSIIRMSSLCIRKGTAVQVKTPFSYAQHTDFMGNLVEGWEKPVELIFGVKNVA